MPPRDIFEEEPKHLLALFKEIQSASDRVAAISATAFLDDSLGVALRDRFISIGRDCEDRIFSRLGAPLGTSAKILMGYALGVFGPLTRKDLDIIRKVRNSFAHTALPIDFDDSELIKKCKELTSPERLALDPEYSGFGRPFDLDKARGRFIYATRSISTLLLLHARDPYPHFRNKAKIDPPVPPDELP
jgi:hypothetical protein